jgi:hypothetical protein
MPNSPERPAVRQTRIAVELTTRAAAEVRRCVAQTRALVAESKFILQRSARHRTGSPQVRGHEADTTLTKKRGGETKNLS